jgi:hypothetical protein
MAYMFVPFLSIIGTFTLATVAIVLFSKTRRRKAELQAEIQTKLIDRFSSAPELIDFLKSPTGQEFVSGVKVQQASAVSRKVIGGIRASVFLATLGVGFLVLWGLAREEGFMYPGIILLSLGGGMFLSTLVSIKLTRDWGLSDDSPKPVPVSSGDVR